MAARNIAGMGLSTREEIATAFAALRAAVAGVLELSFEVLTTRERLGFLEQLEEQARKLPTARHDLINQLAEQADSVELGGKLPAALASRLHISRGEARRRVAEAADLGRRRALTGEPLPPALTATAQAQRTGLIGGGQIRVICGFLDRLPVRVDAATREQAEAQLARLATQFRPEQLAKLAERLMDCLNPDGNFTDEDRARRRGLSLGRQGVDGMSRLTGYLTPQASATLEAVWAKLAAPACATPTMTSRVWRAPPARRRYGAIPAVLGSASMTP